MNCKTCGGAADNNDPNGVICVRCEKYENACDCPPDEEEPVR